MKLSQEMQELFSGFEKRMKFINIARYILDAKNTLSDMIPDKDILYNIIMAVLVFIKERTLGSEQTCTLEDIADFLDDISPAFPQCRITDSSRLARFIVVEVLQKGGILTSYSTFIPGKESFEPVPVRLIEEEKGTYHLTDDAFDFLFRSKEIESELDYSVTRFRMAEYMKRDNYTQALDQSREMVSKIRSMKVSMEDFMRRCRENIGKIAVDQYDVVISKVRSLLTTEYDELRSIQDNARDRKSRLMQAQQNGVDAKDMQKNRRALDEIIRNIQLTIEEQRSLINKKMSLSEAYQSILSDSYAMTRYERLNFDRDILAEMRRGKMPLDESSLYLMFPLTKPEFEHKFSVENFYAMQNRISDMEDEEYEVFAPETAEENPVEARNNRFFQICFELFKFMIGKSRFKISEFISSLENDILYEFCKDTALPNVVLSLYSLQQVSVSQWKESAKMAMLPLGEFELSWCMGEIPDYCLEMDSFTVNKLNREFSFTVYMDGNKREISMSDFEIEVTR